MAILLLVLSCFAISNLPGQVPDGYHVGASVILPDSLVEVLAGGRFRATIHRSVRTPQERDLIAMAERVYPNTDRLLAVARNPAERAKLTAMAAGLPLPPYRVAPRAAGTPTDRWWLDSFDGTWIPFAVTGGAAEYYLGRLRDLGAGRGPFVFGPNVPPDNGSFEYAATIRTGSEQGVANVVELSISWHYSCGTLCAISFTHTRTVWFDAKGVVVRIIGDGQPEVIVS